MKDLYMTNPTLAPAPARGDTLYKDSQVPGLYLRVTAAGSRSWYLQKRLGKHVAKFKLGDTLTMAVNEARLKCIELLKDIAHGENPYAKVRQDNSWQMPLRDLWKKYFDQHISLHVSRPTEIKALVERHWQPLMDQPVGRINAEKIQSWVNALGRTVGEPTANKQFTYLRACLRWGAAKQIVKFPDEPWKYVKKFKERERNAYLSPEDFLRLKAVLDSMPGDIVADMLLMLLYTGQRKSNVFSMEWCEIDLAAGTWTIPASKAKAGKEIIAALPSQALDILMRRRHSQEILSPWVFPSESSASGHRVAIDKEWKEIRDRANLGQITIHGLRHTYGTWLGLSGASAFVIKRGMGHATVRMSEKYTKMDRMPIPELRNYVERALEWGNA